MSQEEIFDFIIVGGGPVGLHAGLKAALLNQTALVLDKGRKWCRVWFVPRIDNIPTHPEGISGAEIVNVGRRALKMYEHKVKLFDFYEVTQIERNESYVVKAMNHRAKQMEEFQSRAVILATGVVDQQPHIGGSIQPILPYANKGIVHYCLFCDGHMMTGENVAVIGHNAYAAHTAEDLNWFEAKSVTVFTHGKEMFEGEDIDEEERKRLLDMLESFGYEIVEEEIVDLFGLKDEFLGIKLANGSERRFDRGMVALGIYNIRNELAIRLGGKVDEDGYVVTDENCRVLNESGEPIEGLYAVGDLKSEWNQVVIGLGDAERAVVHAYAYLL